MARKKMHGNSIFVIGGLTILVAVGALMFILFSVTDYSEKCKTSTSETCESFTGPSFPLVVLLLIISALVLIFSTVVYILVRS